MPRSQLFSPARVRRTLSRIACEIVERNRGGDVHLFGLKQRGLALATLLVSELRAMGHATPDAEPLDIAAFRDDRPGAGSLPRSGGAPALGPEAPNTDGRDVVIVDDVLFTGRTVRAALDAVLRYGRPRSIQLAVLVDRGHREVPVHADFVGSEIPTKYRERVVVETAEPAVYLDE